MSREILEEIDNLCRTVALNTCWRQWGAVGAPVSFVGRWSTRAIVDPEALLLLSSALQGHERRLEDILSWWGKAGSKLLSVHRVGTLLRLFPEDVHLSISSFANAAYQHGDRRWRRLATLTETPSAREFKGAEAPALLEPAALILRLRAGLGISVKSDLLAMLIGMQGSSATVRRMVEALGYSKMAVSVATREMAQSGLLKETSSRPAGYFVQLRAWRELLGFESFHKSNAVTETTKEFPTWHFWSQLFAFLSHVSVWTRNQLVSPLGRYVLSSQARDLYYEHEEAFTSNHISVPDPGQYKGEAYLEAFRLTLRLVSDWVEDNV